MYQIDEFAKLAGRAVQPTYSVNDVATLANIPRTAVFAAVRSGQLESFLPPGMQRGRRIKAEWFETWWNNGKSKEVNQC